ncbi:MAG TPA: TadE/TadG family type IV pilus assembly protein [Gaiellaceae bacterium]|nr:TadE/TadG family type IV pilus assembly protein [Gaiellaceae bacterium]
MQNSKHRKIELSSQKGQSLTEFAIALPILILLLFSVIQFGIIFNNYVTLTDATRAGARKGAVSRQLANPSAATIQAVRDSASDLNQTDLSVTVTSDFTAGSDVTVTATYPYSLKLIGLPIKSGFLSSTTEERVE